MKERNRRRGLAFFAAALLATMQVFQASHACAQSPDDVNLQFHGFVTQAFIYSTQNNWNTTESTGGTPAWTEAVVNLNAQPEPKLRIGMQAHYFLLGDYGNTITIDWAQADYKVNEKLGFRVGKVKTPISLLNEIQDIDPAYLWVILPQSIYPIESRNSTLAHYGGVVYGKFTLGESLGSLEYRAFGGERTLGPDDAYFTTYREEGIQVPNGLSGRLFGGTVIWHTPLHGLIVGADELSAAYKGNLVIATIPGSIDLLPASQPYFFSRYEEGKFMIAGEYSRLTGTGVFQFVGIPQFTGAIDQRAFYGMTSYKLSRKLTGGAYYSSATDRQAAYTSSRYQRDWTLSARYDLTANLYAKFEQHFIDGTLRGYTTADNTNGLRPNDRLTFVKLGVTF